MKIGIITINMYSKGLNFACPLHTYAFQQFLKNNGIESTVINYKPIYFDNFNLKYPAEYYNAKYLALKDNPPASEEARTAYEKKLRFHDKKRTAWTSVATERATRYEKLQAFIEQHYIKTEYCYNSDTLEALDPGFDCYICATDVLWKNQPDYGFDRGFFLSSRCMEQKWKIAYSASRGAYVANNEEEKNLFFHFLDDIDYISVREKSLKHYIEENINKHAQVVLDPVLLNPPEFYDSIIKKPEETNYILLYYVMEKAEDTIRAAAEYAQKHNMQIIEITEHPLKNGKLEKYKHLNRIYHIDLGIEEWLGYIKYADCIFTNSFHACCFSILFEKNFYAGFRKNDKVTNLLETFELTDRAIQTNITPGPRTLRVKVMDRLKRYMKKLSLPEKAPKIRNIDYTHARSILEQKRKESSDFILSAIHNAETQTRTPKDYDSYKKTLKYPIAYNSKLKNISISSSYDESVGILKHLTSGTLEYLPQNIEYVNTGTQRFLKNHYSLPGYTFIGWDVRIRIDNCWFWYLKDGSLKLQSEYNRTNDGPAYRFHDEDIIPYIPVNRISSMIAEAQWEKTDA